MSLKGLLLKIYLFYVVRSQKQGIELSINNEPSMCSLWFLLFNLLLTHIDKSLLNLVTGR
jgi:hypothetical protein